MPCSQMMSMNCRPPRDSALISVAMLPDVNARIRNSSRRNMGCATRVSTTQNTDSTSAPPMSPASTHGLVQPSAWPP